MSTVPIPPLVGVYCRVSTSDQDCSLQLNECREYCERRGWRIAGEYVDTGWSGTKASRPQLDKLMRDARAHRFDCVMVWKVDRFGRSVVNLLEALKLLESYGVRFLVISQSIDTDQASPTSRLLMTILSAVAEFERSMICERVAAGLKAAKRRGVQLGRRKKVFDRGRVRELKLLGKSHRQICSELGVSMGMVIRALKEAA
jgi:putative DNA-invertase from lambdoid prophage Rac